MTVPLEIRSHPRIHCLVNRLERAATGALLTVESLADREMKPEMLGTAWRERL